MKTKLSVEIEKIIKKEGIDVLEDKRFLYILDDVYSFRYEKAKRHILKCLIEDGDISDFISCKNISITTDKIADKYQTQYGFEKLKVKEVLDDIAFAIGKVTSPVASSRSKPKNHLQQQGNNSHPQKYESKKIKDFLLLLFAYCCFFGSLILFIREDNVNSESLYVYNKIAPVIGFVLAVFNPYLWYRITKRNNIITIGAVRAVMLFCIIFFSLPTIVWLVSFFALERFIDVKAINLIMSWILVFIYVKAYHTAKKYINNTMSKKAFCISGGVITLILLIIDLIPLLKAKTENKNSEKQYERNSELRDNRKNNDKLLSFMGINVGTDSAVAFNIIRNLPKDSTYLSEKELDESMLRKVSKEETDEYDRSYKFTTYWLSNNTTHVNLKLIGRTVSVINVQIEHLEADTVIKMYTMKYGEPEIYNGEKLKEQCDFVVKYKPLNYYYERFLAKITYLRLYEVHDWSDLYYVWTYKNGYIYMTETEDPCSLGWKKERQIDICYCSLQEVKYQHEKYKKEGETKIEELRHERIRIKEQERKNKIDSLNTIKKDAEMRKKAINQI